VVCFFRRAPDDEEPLSCVAGTASLGRMLTIRREPVASNRRHSVRRVGSASASTRATPVQADPPEAGGKNLL
jgi:hypothetical protein